MVDHNHFQNMNLDIESNFLILYNILNNLDDLLYYMEYYNFHHNLHYLHKYLKLYHSLFEEKKPQEAREPEEKNPVVVEIDEK